MPHCHEMKKGQIYSCDDCGLELQVARECDTCDEESCVITECRFECCGKELSLKK